MITFIDILSYKNQNSEIIANLDSGKLEEPEKDLPPEEFNDNHWRWVLFEIDVSNASNVEKYEIGTGQFSPLGDLDKVHLVKIPGPYNYKKFLFSDHIYISESDLMYIFPPLWDTTKSKNKFLLACYGLRDMYGLEELKRFLVNQGIDFFAR